MGEVEIEHVNWLWHPYILYVKITLMQRDLGNGKTTMILAIIRQAGFGGFERGELGSTAKHLEALEYKSKMETERATALEAEVEQK